MSILSAAGTRTFDRSRTDSQPVRRRPTGERRDHGDGGESDVRAEVIRRARERIEAGYYDHPLAAHLVADKLARLLAQ